ncbi:DUF4468 domain-containing protein [Mucilaginibacter auburnensis]|uniref:Uncharacterized protein with TBP-like fold DUF4468 n=1 Tax=Mucilaginibacter auburnensis TaxID=1457233 RepID=A0A2H9VML8_9SPHI|nr:DUF4468 domain-containing protein [Mucilaginibacter auburnensis]PJJ79564.1 uncharacterized protein with TBP-like fold DUF4468 [Mucilaginibacter auburnensis]
MKNIILVITIVVFKVTTVFAQADSLVIDENNKYIYYQVVAQPGSSADSLQARAVYFAKKAFADSKLKFKKSEKGTIRATGGVLVSKKSSIGLHEDARIDYTMVIEVKDNRYRYWFTDFIIVPYARDRYANFVPVSGKNTPLENGLSSLSKKDFDGYTAKLFATVKDIGNRLKTYMKTPVAPVKQEVKKTTIPATNW